MKLYIASSWKNTYYPEVVNTLREAGFEVYDFRNPPVGGGFKWKLVAEDYMEWSPEKYREQLYNNPLAKQQFKNDIEAMESCDACVLVLPCGRSAHTEAGWFAGRGKPVIAYLPEKTEPELMYGLFRKVCCDINEVVEELKKINPVHNFGLCEMEVKAVRHALYSNYNNIEIEYENLAPDPAIGQELDSAKKLLDGWNEATEHIITGSSEKSPMVMDSCERYRFVQVIERFAKGIKKSQRRKTELEPGMSYKEAYEALTSFLNKWKESYKDVD